MNKVSRRAFIRGSSAIAAPAALTPGLVYFFARFFKRRTYFDIKRKLHVKVIFSGWYIEVLDPNTEKVVANIPVLDDDLATAAFDSPIIADLARRHETIPVRVRCTIEMPEVRQYSIKVG